jgi:hypothetical protein
MLSDSLFVMPSQFVSLSMLLLEPVAVCGCLARLPQIAMLHVSVRPTALEGGQEDGAGLSASSGSKSLFRGPSSWSALGCHKGVDSPGILPERLTPRR